MRVVVKTLIVFVVVFKHGERLKNCCGILAACRFGDVVKYPAEVVDKFNTFSCKYIECILNYQFRQRILSIPLPNQTSCSGTNLSCQKLLKLPDQTSCSGTNLSCQKLLKLPDQASCLGTNLPSKKLLKLLSLRSFVVFWGSFSPIIFLRMSSMAELWLESLCITRVKEVGIIYSGCPARLAISSPYSRYMALGLLSTGDSIPYETMTAKKPSVKII